MAAGGLPLILDDTLPFVEAVLAAAEHSPAVDTAADILRQIERAHGIEILCDLCPDSVLPAGVFCPRADGLSYRDLLPLLSDWNAFQQHYESAADEDIDSTLYPFLSDTQMILQGSDFTNDHFIRTADGTIHAWSQRAWGQELANWANTTGWGPHHNRHGERYSWKYTDFYIDMSDHTVSNYDQWRDTCLKVIKRKCQRQLRD